MANVKITDLTAYTNPDSTDVLPIVDVGADVTKKISIADLLENAGSGTASAPGIAFDGDSNTGIYRPSADQVGIATNGSQALLIDASGNVTAAGTSTADSFIPTSSSVPTNGMYLPAANNVAISTNGVQRLLIEADGDINIDSGGVFYDAANNRLAIGTTSPSNPLNVYHATINNVALFESGDANCEIAIADNTGRVAIGNVGDDLRFLTSSSGNERARIDSSGRLLVGTSSVSSDITIAAQGNSLTSTGPAYLQLRRGALPSDTQSLGWIQFADNSGNVGAQIYGEATQNWTSGSAHGTAIVLSTTANGAGSPTPRMEIDRNGLFVTFGETHGIIATSAAGAGTTNYVFRGTHSRNDLSSGGINTFFVYTNGDVKNTNNSYTAISDINLKENIVAASSQWTDVKAIEIVNYNFKEETGHQTHKQLGVIAQQVELVSPGLVSESPDLDEEGNDLGTVTKSVNYSVLYMKAVKALQEAMERIEQLEISNAELLARVTALEAS